MKSEGNPSRRVPTRDLSRSWSGPQDCPSISCCKERSCFSRTPITASPPTRRAFRLASGSIRDMRQCISSGESPELCGLHPPAPCHPLHAYLCRFLHAVRHSRYLHQTTFRHAPRHIGESVSLVAGLPGLGHRTLWAMARAAPKINDSAASACGRLIALYSRFLIRDVTTQVLFVTPLGSRPVVSADACCSPADFAPRWHRLRAARPQRTGDAGLAGRVGHRAGAPRRGR